MLILAAPEVWRCCSFRAPQSFQKIKNQLQNVAEYVEELNFENFTGADSQWPTVLDLFPNLVRFRMNKPKYAPTYQLGYLGGVRIRQETPTSTKSKLKVLNLTGVSCDQQLGDFYKIFPNLEIVH